jgi:PKD repeat protein
LSKTAPSIAAALALLALSASPALGAPVPSFTVSPNPPVSGVEATYTSTSTADDTFAVAEVDWDFDNNGDYEVKDTTAPFTATHTYARAGAKTLKMRVVDNAATPVETVQEKNVIVVSRPPTADFTFSPLSPFAFDDVLFAPDASDPDGDALSYRWDFGDGTDDSTAHFPVHNFASKGTKTVTLTVTDEFGLDATVSHDITVKGPVVPGNNLPVARFAWSPRPPRVGDAVEFISSSYDTDGEIKQTAWDLDGDGEFDDARSDDILHTFTRPGTKTIRLRVTDNAGASSVAVHTFTVERAPKGKPGFMQPPPRFAFNGLIFSNGMRMLAVGARAPRGALVTIRCKGKGCPVKQRRKRVKKSTVRFRTFERFLRPGIKLEYFITKKGKVGTYRSYVIRAGKRPKIRGGCVTTAKLKRSRCPK